MTQSHGGHILTFNLKKSLQISMHLGGKDINFGFGGGRGGILILCKIYTPGQVTFYFIFGTGFRERF